MEIVQISKFPNKILYQSKKLTPYILNFIEACRIPNESQGCAQIFS